jgi:hypothetical protein
MEIDEQLQKYIDIMKEEEVLSYFIRIQRQNGLDSTGIIKAWTVFKPTITKDNVDITIAEYRLRLIVSDNRAQLNYNPNDIFQMIDKAVTRARE